MRRAPRLILFVVLAAACGDESDLYVQMMPDDLPTLVCSAVGVVDGDLTWQDDCAMRGSDESGMGGAGSSDSGGDDECLSSDECIGGICIADFRNGEVGEFACVSTCIGEMDEASWCLDAEACCDAQAECTSRGYCVVPDGGSG